MPHLYYLIHNYKFIYDAFINNYFQLSVVMIVI